MLQLASEQAYHKRQRRRIYLHRRINQYICLPSVNVTLIKLNVSKQPRLSSILFTIQFDMKPMSMPLSLFVTYQQQVILQ